jgi:hypothetical protein
MIVEEATMDRHLYVLPLERFKINFVWDSCVDLSAPADTGSELLKAYIEKELIQKREQGFKLYSPNTQIRRWMYRLTRDDASADLSTGFFMTKYGALVPVQEGDFLAVPSSMDEVYLIPSENENLYVSAPVDGSGKIELKPKQRFLSQSEMLSLFQKRILEEGTLFRKTGDIMARDAELKERIYTRVHGRIISVKVVVDETDVVIRASEKNMYVVSRARFEKLYFGPDEQEEVGPIGLQRMLSTQGFRNHKPRPENLRWAYKVREEDVQAMNVPKFMASFGSTQEVRVGDFLAIPCNSPIEIYLMPAAILMGKGYEAQSGLSK